MSQFNVTTHTINASHIREFPRGTTSAYADTPLLKLVVNQYVPKDYTPKKGDMSIIFCHANAFHKVHPLTHPLPSPILSTSPGVS